MAWRYCSIAKFGKKLGFLAKDFSFIDEQYTRFNSSLKYEIEKNNKPGETWNDVYEVIYFMKACITE